MKGQKEFPFFLYTERQTWLPEALCPPRASPSSLQPPSASQTSGTHSPHSQHQVPSEAFFAFSFIC